MKTTTTFAVRAVQRSLRDGSNLATLLVLSATIASLVFMLYVGIGTRPTVIPASGVDTLRADRAVRELDEAAFAATWAQSRATPPQAVTVVIGADCEADCARTIWPDGTAVTTDMTTALDYAALCSCPIVVQSR